MTITVDRQKGLSGGLAIKAPVRVATTANITLSGLQTIDGVTVVADDRVLVKDQTNGVENGIYVASSSAWQRDIDFNGSSDIVQGTFVKVQSGSTNASSVYEVSTTSPVIGTSSISFSRANDVALAANLASSGGAALVGSDDGSGGSIWTTVAGAISSLLGGRTSVSAGMIKSSGTQLSVAVAGTDYLAPSAIGVTVQAYDADIPTVSGTSAEIVTGTQTALRSWAPDVLSSAIISVARPVVMTTQASTSGSTIDFTGIPSWATQITISFYNVSLSSAGTNYLIQLGTGSGIENTTYDSSSEYGGTGTTSSSGFVMRNGSADSSVGSMVLTSLGSNRWVESGWLRPTNGAGSGGVSVGSKTLSGTLDRVRIANTGGDTFDNGYIGVRYS